MKTCKNGHPWTPENRRGRHGENRTSCRPCENERRRVKDPKPNVGRVRRFCAKGHDKDLVGRNRRGRCRQCIAEDSRIRAIRDRDARAERYRVGFRTQKPDGWEDEFGPVPSRVPNSTWIDWVAVDRYLEGRPARDLTSGEYRALHLLEVLRRGAPGGDSEPDLVPMIKTSVWHPKGTGSQLRLRRKVG